MKLVVRGSLLTFLFAMVQLSATAQCAMCRATLENNVSNGNIGIAAGINFGIMYLFAAPYLVIATIAYFWYKSSKNARTKKYA
ncbi:MAG: hypothetical protein J0L66_01350 [Cytophagales bacterium]|nr:hypothetical protein [Cytophagales bacterium]